MIDVKELEKIEEKIEKLFNKDLEKGECENCAYDDRMAKIMRLIINILGCCYLSEYEALGLISRVEDDYKDYIRCFRMQQYEEKNKIDSDIDGLLNDITGDKK
jgi:hypothetical protein